MENFERKDLTERIEKRQGEVFNPSGSNKELQRMKQEIMLQRLANYRDDNTIAKKINKFFSIFF